MGECENSNAILVRTADNQAIRLGKINDTETTLALCDWLEEGTPLPLPQALQKNLLVRNGEAA